MEVRVVCVQLSCIVRWRNAVCMWKLTRVYIKIKSYFILTNFNLKPYIIFALLMNLNCANFALLVNPGVMKSSLLFYVLNFMTHTPQHTTMKCRECFFFCSFLFLLVILRWIVLQCNLLCVKQWTSAPMQFWASR